MLNSSHKRELSMLLDDLSSIRGNGTSLISLYIPSSMGQQNRANDLLKKELTQCQSIKDRAVRSAVKNALTSIQRRFKSLKTNDFLPNGIAIFAGQDIKNKNRMMIQIAKPKLSSIHNLLYSCGKKFDLSILEKDLSSTDKDKYGVVVISGKELFIGSVSGDDKKCLFNKTVDLPKKHGRGGQSQARFSRQRV